MIPALIGYLATTRIGEKWAKPAAYGILAIGAALLLFGGWQMLKHKIISDNNTQGELKQGKLERKADANLNTQTGRDQAAAEQRQQEIDNATRNIPDQAPSAQQRARACVELWRQAKAKRQPEPAC